MGIRSGTGCRVARGGVDLADRASSGGAGWHAAVLAVLMAFAISPLLSADLEREQRLRAEIVDAIFDGEPIDLATPAGFEFLGIYAASDTDEPRGGVLILHGRGFHPDWVDVVQPLRVGLLEHGWNTLSIQLPVLEKDAKYNDYVPLFGEAIPRIEAAIAELRTRGNDRVVVVAHSCGFHMANHWLLKRGSQATERMDAFVGIGVGATDYGQPMVEPMQLELVDVPVLDLYGGDDFPAVLRKAPARKEQLARAGNPLSAQLVIAGADHYFKGRNDELIEVVAAWLAQL